MKGKQMTSKYPNDGKYCRTCSIICDFEWIYLIPASERVNRRWDVICVIVGLRIWGLIIGLLYMIKSVCPVYGGVSWIHTIWLGCDILSDVDFVERLQRWKTRCIVGTNNIVVTVITLESKVVVGTNTQRHRGTPKSKKSGFLKGFRSPSNFWFTQ